MGNVLPYTKKQFDLSGLHGISDKTMETHFKLYEGYVDAIGWRSTHLRTLANNLVVVPNAVLSKAIITNYHRPSTNVGCCESWIVGCAM